MGSLDSFLARINSELWGAWIARGEESGAAAMCEARLMSGQAIIEDLTHRCEDLGEQAKLQPRAIWRLVAGRLGRAFT